MFSWVCAVLPHPDPPPDPARPESVKRPSPFSLCLVWTLRCLLRRHRSLQILKCSWLTHPLNTRTITLLWLCSLPETNFTLLLTLWKSLMKTCTCETAHFSSVNLLLRGCHCVCVCVCVCEYLYVAKQISFVFVCWQHYRPALLPPHINPQPSPLCALQTNHFVLSSVLILFHIHPIISVVSYCCFSCKIVHNMYVLLLHF